MTLSLKNLHAIASKVDLIGIVSSLKTLRETRPELLTIDIPDALELFPDENIQKFLRALLEITPLDIGLENRIKFEHVPVSPFVKIHQRYIGADGVERNPNIKILPEHVYMAYQLMQRSYLDFLRLEGINNRPGLIVLSGYRSPGYQLLLLANSIGEQGIDIALRNTSLPFFSEHGDPNYTAIDFMFIGDDRGKRVSNNRSVEFELYREFDWLIEHGPEYGFVLTLPPDEHNPRSGRTAEGFEYEPWHWRFIGSPEEATKYTKSNRVIEKLNARRKAIATTNYDELLDLAIQIP